MLIYVQPVDPLWVHMVVTGDIDAVSEAALDTAIFVVLRHHRPRHIALQVAGVGFIDAAGVSALLRCHATARAFGCDLTLTDPQPAVHRVLEIVGLTAHFGVGEAEYARSRTRRAFGCAHDRPSGPDR
nr:STAS domain-containing protein [uncultured Actinoplanes sp.]